MFYNLHTHILKNTQNTIELLNQYPWDFKTIDTPFSIGIHPWYINEDRLEQDLKKIEFEIYNKNCLAIGECGLDKRIDIPLANQIEVFKAHVFLAEKYKMPLILHLVGAFDELLLLKKEYKISVPIIIHGFSKNEILAKQLISNGCFLSLGKYLFSNPEVEKVLKNLPLSSFFLETDMQNISIEEVYKKAASIKECSLCELENQIEINWKNVFNKM